jgi:hypothetical protein
MANRYKEIERLRNEDGKRYFKNAIYPDIPFSENDTYVITTGADRYDTLAKQFYNDSSLWWVIATANTSKRDGLIVEQGIQLRIPGNISAILEEYNLVNANR